MSETNDHLDQDDVALRALGESLGSDSEAHLLDCAECSEAVAQLQRVVLAAPRSAAPDWQPSVPSPQLWARISDELDLGATERPQVSSIKRQRRWTTSTMLAASFIGVIAGAALALGGAILISGPAPNEPIAAPTPQVLEKTVLAPLPDHTGSGRAEIVQTSRGSELIVDVDDMTKGDGFYEVWLINPKTKAMVGLGSLNGQSGRFPIPEGLDVSQYSLVDVSIEPFDGDPTHSGDSVVRGELAV